MPKVSALQGNFNTGEMSPLLYGRVDAERYKAGLAICLNYIPTIQGALTRRPGSYFVAAVKTSSKSTRLVSFEFSTTQAYVIEFGNQYFRFFKDEGQIALAATNITAITKASPGVVTSNAHGYSNGDRVVIAGVGGMVQLNNLEYIIAGVTANTYTLTDVLGNAINTTTFTTYNSGGTAEKIYEVASSYLEADLFQLKFTQSADVLYIVHPDYAPRKLSRTGHTSWTLTTITFLDGPYLSTNITATTLTPGAATGSGVTLTASATTGINGNAGFATTDVGRLIRLQQGSVWGYVLITAFTSTTVVTVTVLNTLTNTNAKAVWRLGVWSDTTGYPATVTFHEDRLIFGGAPDSPQRIDGSKSGDYENFAPSAIDGSIADDNALSFTMNATDVNVVRWTASEEKGLLAGTVGGEWVIRPSTIGEALSPTNISAKKSTSYGSADISPVQAGKANLFVQRAGRKIREMTYSFNVDGYSAADITILSEHITQSGLVELAYQKEPQPVMWCVRQDGVLAGLTYDRDLDSVKAAWHRHVIGGYSDAAQSAAQVESVACIPSPDGTRDQVWIIVKRWINGIQRRYIEFFEKIFDDSDLQQNAFFVDGGLTYDNPITITGATKANPVVVTANSHGFSNGDVVLLSKVVGMTELNAGTTYTVANKTSNTFELSGIDGSAYGTYVSGGEARKMITTLSGLGHLEGETVSILADGAVQPMQVVTGGAIILTFHAAVVHIGYGYNSDGQMLRLEAGAADGTAMGKTRRTHRVGFLLHNSLGLKIGMSFDALDTLTFRTSADPLSRAPPLVSGIRSETIQCDYDFENQVCWRQDQPLPSTILAVMPQMVTQDRG